MRLKSHITTRLSVACALSAWLMGATNTTAEQEAISKMRGYYESFFTARYSLEQEFPFRLISIRDELVEYQPQTNVLSSIFGAGIEKRLANVDANEIKGALINALTPVLYTLTTQESDAIDFFAIANQVASKAFKDMLSIRAEINKALAEHKKEKLTYHLYFAPYRKTDARLVYNEHKINMVRYGKVALFNDQREKAQSVIAQEIDLQRAHLYYAHDQQTVPTFLAAGMHFTFSKDTATLNCEILVHLYPRAFPYKETVDNITFRQIIIPAGDDFRHPVALLKIAMPIYQTGEPEEPTLTVQFGSFSDIKEHRFVIAEQKNKRFTPYLLGNVRKFKPLDVRFQFKTILLSLRTLQAESVKMVFSPTLKVGSLVQADLGGYTLKKVNEEFKTSINASLNEAKDKAIDQLTLELKKEMTTVIEETAKNKEVSDLLKEGVMFGLEKILTQAEEKLNTNAN